MKILLIQPTGDKRGHYGIYTVHVCQELARRGHEVCLFTNKVYPELFLPEKPLFDIVEHENGVYAFDDFDDVKSRNALKYTYGYLRNSFVILRAGLIYARKQGFDVVQIFDTEYGTISILLHLFKNNLPPIALMVNAPNFAYSEYSGPLLIKLYKTLQKKLLGSLLGTRIRGVNMLGEFHREEFRRQFDLPESFPIAVIYDGADTPDTILSKEEARAKLAIPFDGTLFLFFGMLRRDKGIESFFEAISLVQEKNFKVLMAGSLFDYTEVELKDLIKHFGIVDKIILRTGYIDDKDVNDYFFASDVLVLPYGKLYRGGSGPLLKQGAVCKVPAIVSDIAEMGRLVRQHDMGLIAEAENPSSLSLAMEEFLKTPPERRREMGEHAFLAANTWKTMAQGYESFYNKII